MKTFAVVAAVSMTVGCPGDDGTTSETNAATTSGPGTTGGTAADSDSSGGGGPPFGSAEDVMMAATLWTNIQGYDQWGQIMGKEGVQPSEAPHSAFAQIYLNDVAAGDATYPTGSIIVKANVSDDMGTTVEAVTVMQKMADFEPMAADWFWAKYLPDGTLDMNGDGVPLAGRVGLGGAMGCIPCHGEAAGGDYVYTND